MKSTLLVPFGLKDDKLYEPKPTQVENGKACGCVCPACKKPLVAKQNAKTPHFAHAQDENCSRGLETAVHLAVKQIIAEKMEVRLPAVVWTSSHPRYKQTTKLYIERTIQLDSVVLEQSIDDFKPDIVVQSNGTTYLVEVAVTHFVKDEKQAKINRKKIPTFEIDVSHLKNGFTLAELEQAIYTNRNYQAEWKYHPRLEELTLEEKKAEEDRIAKIEEEEQIRQVKFERYRRYSPEQKLNTNLRTIGLTEQQMNRLTALISWSDSFAVPGIVWQSAVLAYISKVQDEKCFEDWLPCSVNAYDCMDWLNEAFKIKPIFHDAEKIALWNYFKHLEILGILKFQSNKTFDLFVGK